MSVNRTCPACGFTRSYATDGIADYHHGRHSCGRHQHLTDLARRRVERAGAGVLRDCGHTQTHHLHGTRAAYVRDRCRCRACTCANTSASRLSDRQRSYGRWSPSVDAAPAREQVLALRAAGLGIRRIAQLAGVSPATVKAIIDTTDGRVPRGKIRPDTAESILAVKARHAAPARHSNVDATGTRRRLQALVAIGWSLQQLASRLDRTTSHLARTMSGNQVTIRTAENVRALYDQLWDVRPPQHTSATRAEAEAARIMAAQNGWRAPLAWDDIDTDHEPIDSRPCARTSLTLKDLDEIAIERAVAGDGIRLDQLTAAEQAEVVRQLTERGESIRDIASRLRTTTRTVSRRRRSAKAA